jgi:cation:H+ antiporter
VAAVSVALGLALLVIGVVALERGADLFVDSATALARARGASLTVIGLLTVGIEWEELAVVALALAQGAPRLALGALLGACIANMTLVLAAGLLARPLRPAGIERMLGLIVLGATLLVAAMAGAGRFGHREGVVLLGVFVVYAAWLARELRGGAPLADADDPDDDDAASSSSRLAGALALGLALALVGGELVVRGGLRVAHGAGLSDTLAGLTVVGLGASVPDAFVSFTAARRGAAQLALANAAGSSVCNLLLLLGVTALARPLDVPSTVVDVDVPVLLTVTALFALTLRRNALTRGYGVAVLVIYVLYFVSRLA